MRRLAGLSLRQRLLIVAGAVGAVVVLVVAILLIASASGADDQPIAFNHQVHVGEYQMQCVYCHSGVTQSPVAGIPSVEKCMGCHTHIATDNDEIVALQGYWDRQEPIPWVRVHEQPDFVYFNHQAHFAAGVNCASCHGDMEDVTVAEEAVNMNMGFCLDCHAEQENKDELWDCAICHR